MCVLRIILLQRTGVRNLTWTLAQLSLVLLRQSSILLPLVVLVTPMRVKFHHPDVVLALHYRDLLESQITPA